MRDEKYKHPYKDKTAKVNKAKKIEDKKRKEYLKKIAFFHYYFLISFNHKK